ncbi:MAG: hypothetical protein IT381_24080 [Deltaproteobacteria bacterium]|nr:hypothetical protein [Deltaproteobacteria bacterium]
MHNTDQQLELFASAPVEVTADWLTGVLPDRSGMGAYIILIRSPDDPERAPRQKGSDKAPHLTLRKQSIAKWRDAIAALLEDGRAVTFNAICLELAGLTADICLDEVPEHALWSLVEQGRVTYSTEAPILFRKTLTP